MFHFVQDLGLYEGPQVYVAVFRPGENLHVVSAKANIQVIISIQMAWKRKTILRQESWLSLKSANGFESFQGLETNPCIAGDTALSVCRGDVEPLPDKTR